MKEIENLKKKILKEYPRLNKDSKFKFRCHPGVSCFNDCCGDVNIFLTPYDIIRLKNRLGITSGEFLSKYTIAPFDRNLKYPVVMLKMEDDERKSCPLVSKDGCTVYEDRPWACRMYPLGLASPTEGNEEVTDDFYFLLEEDVCKGFKEDREISVSEWIEDQGIAEYDEIGRLFQEIALHPALQGDQGLSEKKIEMFFMVCYNIDAFKKFVFESSFLDKFDVDTATQEKIKNDDVELMKFGFNWLRFALFGEKTMQIKQAAAEAVQAEIKRKTELEKKLGIDKKKNK